MIPTKVTFFNLILRLEIVLYGKEIPNKNLSLKVQTKKNVLSKQYFTFKKNQIFRRSVNHFNTFLTVVESLLWLIRSPSSLLFCYPGIDFSLHIEDPARNSSNITLPNCSDILITTFKKFSSTTFFTFLKRKNIKQFLVSISAWKFNIFPDKNSDKARGWLRGNCKFRLTTEQKKIRIPKMKTPPLT